MKNISVIIAAFAAQFFTVDSIIFHQPRAKHAISAMQGQKLAEAKRQIVELQKLLRERAKIGNVEMGSDGKINKFRGKINGKENPFVINNFYDGKKFNDARMNFIPLIPDRKGKNKANYSPGIQQNYHPETTVYPQSTAILPQATIYPPPTAYPQIPAYQAAQSYYPQSLMPLATTAYPSTSTLYNTQFYSQIPSNVPYYPYGVGNAISHSKHIRKLNQQSNYPGYYNPYAGAVPLSAMYQSPETSYKNYDQSYYYPY